MSALGATVLIDSLDDLEATRYQEGSRFASSRLRTAVKPLG